MDESLKHKLERINDNFQRLLVDPKQKDKMLLISGTLMKYMRLIIVQLDRIERALKDEGIL